MALLMRSRLFWRRSAAAAGTYASAALGFGATVVALHVFSTETFGRYALVMAATALAQSLLDLTVEEALVKFGFGELRAHRLWAHVFLGNTASEKLLQKLGFRYEGCTLKSFFVRNAWHDLQTFAMLRSEWEKRGA